jgi:elongation factor Ts
MSATITAADINKLRQNTGAAMMDCKKALTESNGDFEAAIDWLRKQGQKIAAKRSDREAKEGVVISATNETNTVGYALCLACETDFVSKNADFVSFAESILAKAVANDVTNLEQLLNDVKMDGGLTVGETVNEKIASIGEKVNVTKYERVEAAYVSSYIHGANRMAVLVGFNKTFTAEAGKDVAMQIAAMNPVAVDADAVSADMVERERAIIVDIMKQDPKMEGKPDEMISKIAEGKLNAFFKENTLTAQLFVKDQSKTVEEYIKSVAADAKVISFKRVALG